MTLFTLRRPIFEAHKFSGLASISNICGLANTYAYTVTSNKEGCMVLTIAGLTLQDQELLCREPDGKLVVMSVADANRKFEVRE